MGSFNETAQKQIHAAQGAARDAASHSQMMGVIFYSHVIKAQMEMVKGVSEVLSRELGRVNRFIAEASEPKDAADQSAKQ